MMDLRESGGEEEAGGPAAKSQLRQWPIQLHLASPMAPYFQKADVVVAADCTAYAYGNFHQDFIKGKAIVIACPKLDDMEPYVAKLAAIFSGNPIRSITVAHMEVPCCTGIVRAVREALERAGRTDIPLHDVTVGIEGGISGL